MQPKPMDDLGVMPAAEKLMRSTAFAATEHLYDIDLGEDGEPNLPSDATMNDAARRLGASDHHAFLAIATPSMKCAFKLICELIDRIEQLRGTLYLIAEGKGGKADCIRRFAATAIRADAQRQG